jgi:multidrug efflux pump
LLRNSGITSATVLTLFYLPALYAASFKVRMNERAGFVEPDKHDLQNGPDTRNGGRS